MDLVGGVVAYLVIWVVVLFMVLPFGVLLATAITLFVVPCGYMILYDLGRSLAVEVRRRLGRAPGALAGGRTASG